MVQLLRGLDHDAGETASSITNPEIRNVTTGLVLADYAVRVKAVSSGDPRGTMALLLKLGDILKQPPAEARWNPSIRHVWLKSNIALAGIWRGLSKRFPDDGLVHYNAGLWLLNFQQYEDAVPYFRTAARSQHLPESMRGTAFRNLGIALMNSGHAVQAEIPLLNALKQSSPDMQAYCVLSEVYKQTKRAEEAAHAEANCRNLVMPSKNVAQ